MTRRLAPALASLGLLGALGAQQAPPVEVRVHELPALAPDRAVAGAFAGVSGGVLLLAGGASFPDGRPWDGAPKVWHDRVLALVDPSADWRELEVRLPRPVAYGVALSHGDRVLCLGGGDADAHHEACYAVRWRPEPETVEIEPLPPLPAPVAFACGAMLGDVAYVLGGQDRPGATTASGRVFALDLASASPRWSEVAGWPGRGRILAVAGVQDGALHVFSGADLETAPDGTAVRVPLVTAFRLRPAVGWEPIADLPHPTIAAPSPALPLGQAHLAIVGGDDAALHGRDLRDGHPGFSHEVLVHHGPTDTWRTLARLPADRVVPVTTPTVEWAGGFVLPSGEARPGVRTPQVLQLKFTLAARPFAPLDYAVLGAYLAALLAVGAWFARREGSTDDFFLGGRRIPWWAAGLSIFGTQLSAITFMAIPALVFRTNWVYLVGNLTIALTAPVVVYAYLPHFRRLEVTTAYEVLERRFSLAVRLCGSAAFLLFQAGRMGILLYLPSLALATVTGFDVVACIVVMGVLATIYTVLGGIEAVVWTDVLQVVVLLGGALVSLLVVLLGQEAPLTDVVAEAFDAGKLHVATLGSDPTTTVLWVVVVGRMLENLVPYTSDQTVVQRYLTTKDRRQAARSIWTNAVLSVPASLLFFTVGTALWAHYREHPERLDALGRHDDVFAWFIARELPAGLSGLVVAGLFAASMSSLDSSMNSMATATTTDWIRRLRSRPLGEATALRLARTLSLAFGVVGTGSALWLAALETTSLWDQYTRIVGLFGGGLAGLFALAVFSKRAHARGALVGFALSAVILLLARPHVHFFLHAGIGVVSCVACGLVASRLLPAPPRDQGSTTAAANDSGRHSSA